MIRHEEKVRIENEKGKRILLVCFAIMIFIGLLKFIGNSPIDCDHSSYQLSILIDDSDPLSEIIIKRIGEDIGSVRSERIKENIRVNFFRVSRGLLPSNKPDSVCLPKECTLFDNIVRGCKHWSDAEKEFRAVLSRTVSDSLANHSEVSPIVESLINIQGGLFLNSRHSKHSSLYVYSDMMQHSGLVDLYQTKLTQSPSGLPHLKLDTDEIRICVIQRQRDLHFQTRLLPVWKEIINGGNLRWDETCKLVVN
jgi:hypothetical protein